MIAEVHLPMSVFDLAFVLCAAVFNLLIVGIYFASRHELVKLRDRLGTCVILLGIPLGIVFIDYLIAGRSTRILLYFGAILVYLVVELLLDFILKIDFKNKPILHIPYIILFYIASAVSQKFSCICFCNGCSL